MSILPEVNDDHQMMASHRQRLVRTIDKTADWRRRKIEEYSENQVAVRRGRRIVAALEALAEYVEGLPDDDPVLRLTLRAFHNPGEAHSSYTYTLVADENALARYGLGLSGDPTDADHDKFLRDLSSVEIQRRSMSDAQRAGELVKQVYGRVRKLRAIQGRAAERPGDELAEQIESQLTAVWNATYDSGEEASQG